MGETAGKLWFRAKRYGYGWYPVTWQGWTVIGIYAILLACLIVIFENHLDYPFAAAYYLAGVAVLTISLIVVAAKKGEPTRWRWGK